MHGFLSGLSILCHWSVCLFLCQYSTVLITLGLHGWAWILGWGKGVDQKHETTGVGLANGVCGALTSVGSGWEQQSVTWAGLEPLSMGVTEAGKEPGRLAWCWGRL